jgi:hypothetical protein
MSIALYAYYHISKVRQTVNPDNAYWVWSEDGSVGAAMRTGADLMEAGLALTLPDRYTCDLIYLRDAALGKPDGLEAPGAFNLLPAETSADAFHTSAKLSWEPSAHARSYRVTVAADNGFEKDILAKTVNGTTCRLPKLAPEKTLYYRVQALSWGGTHDADDGPGSFLTPKLAELPGVTFVSDMDWVKSNAGAKNEVHRDTNYGGSEISVAGKTCPKGVWTHAYNDATPADVVIDVAGKPFARFLADAGVEDSGGGGSVQFKIWIDGKMRAKSPVMTHGSAHHFDVDITGAKEITLRVLNGGDGYQCDHAAWSGARFLKAGAEDVVF